MVKFCVCHSFPFGIEGGIWDVIVLIPDHCLSIYFDEIRKKVSFVRRPKTIMEIIHLCSSDDVCLRKDAYTYSTVNKYDVL